MNLYEIDDSLQKAFAAAIDPETGEVVDDQMFDAFNQLTLDRDKKIENICLYIKNLKSDAAQLKAEKENFAARQKAAESRAEHLTEYLRRYLDGQKYKAEDGRAAVSYRKSQSISITDIHQIPEKYLTKPEPVANKADIKAAMKNGEEIPGAELVTNQNIVIR